MSVTYDLAGQKKAYAKWAAFYDYVYLQLLADSQRKLAAAASACGPEILEVGVGTGLVLRYYPRTVRVVGVDLSEPMLQKAVEKVAGQRLSQVRGLAAMDACRLGFPDQRFDAVAFPFVITLVPDPEGALNEAARVLKPDGFLLVIEPSVEGRYYQLVRLYHDETAERLAAQAALARAASRFRDVAKFGTVHLARYATFEALVTRALGQGFNAIARERVESEGVRAMFESGRTAAGDFQFEQPMLIDLYRGPLAG